MKRNIFAVSVVLILLVSACAPKAAPTVNPVDIQNTAQAAAYTMAAQTIQAMPTNTPVPTETPSPIPLPTDTVPPLPTIGTPATLSPGVTLPTSLPALTPQSPSGSGNSQDPCNQALTTWQGPTANFTIAHAKNETIVLSMYVVTDMGQCGYLVINGDSFSGPAGQYSAGAFITGKKNTKAFGSFSIKGGSWKIIIKNGTITALGSCYPDC